MKNFIQPGNVLTLTAPAALASGQGAAIGVLLAVATNAIASGAAGEFRVSGVIELPKDNSNIAAGARVNWDVDPGQISTGSPTNGDLVGVGVAVAAAGTGAATVRVLLTPGIATVHSGG